MTRGRIISLVIGALVVAVIAWVASNTYWGEVVIPMPLRGEARTNPFYGAQRFAEALGARTSWDHVFSTPPPDGVVVISSWHWSLTDRRRASVERWVEGGGRLVVDSTIVAGEDDFEEWSGVRRRVDPKAARSFLDGGQPEERCRTLSEEPERGARGPAQYQICATDRISTLVTSRPTLWSLSDKSGMQVVRLRQGRGSVTVINGVPFSNRGLTEGEHGRLFVAATELRRGDQVHFMSEDEHPSLVSMAWRYGAPVVVLGLALVGLALWRGGTRFGPLAAPTTAARRSLAEQIQGTGLFALRHGGGASLHTAAVRALGEAAAKRIPGYAHLTEDARIEALAHLTGIDRQALAGAMQPTGPRRGPDLRHAVALIETARRRLPTERRQGRS